MACILVPTAERACVGTTLRYRPGLITGGSGLTHDCGKARGMGYFLEPLVCLALFGKKVRINSDCTGPKKALCLIRCSTCLTMSASVHYCTLVDIHHATSCTAIE